MNESEYIDATDLAKLRIIVTILRDLNTPIGNVEWEHDLTGVFKTINPWIDQLERRVSDRSEP